MNIDILRRIVELHKNGLQIDKVFKNVTKQTQDIYSHHFGYSLIYGKGSQQAKGYPRHGIKLILKDKKIWSKDNKNVQQLDRIEI